jgi:hypothetical protein
VGPLSIRSRCSRQLQRHVQPERAAQRRSVATVFIDPCAVSCFPRAHEADLSRQQSCGTPASRQIRASFLYNALLTLAELCSSGSCELRNVQRVPEPDGAGHPIDSQHGPCTPGAKAATAGHHARGRRTQRGADSARTEGSRARSDTSHKPKQVQSFRKSARPRRGQHVRTRGLPSEHQLACKLLCGAWPQASARGVRGCDVS